MKYRFAIVIAITLLLCNAVQAQEKYSKVKIEVKSAEEKKRLVAALQLDHFLAEGSSIICEISADELTILKNTSFRYEVLVADVAAQLAETNTTFDLSPATIAMGAEGMGFDGGCKTVSNLIKAPPSFHTNGAMGGYYTFSEMETAMNNLVAAFPTLVQKFSLGKSVENRDIWCIKISDNVSIDESEPEVLYSGLQHAREAITGTSLIFFMQYLTEFYKDDARVQSLVNHREIFIVPCVNPDGYVQNQTTNPGGGGMWRKNKSGADGTDLNRNYSVDWGRTGGGSTDPLNDTYWGKYAFSEPETAAMRAFITSRNFVVAIDQHCYGPYYSLPFGFSTGHTLSAEDQNFYSYIPALMGKYNCHRAGNSPQTVGYEVAGGIKDYFVLGDIGVGTKQKVLGMTGEAGGGSFWAPKSSIISLSQGLCFQNLQLAMAAGSYMDLQDVNDIDVTTTTGSFSFLLRRIGVANEPVTVTLMPIENIQTTGPAVTTSINNYYQTYTGAINYTLPSGITNGRRIKYAWKVETGGMTTYDTVVKFYNPNIILADDMEGAITDNWVIPATKGKNSVNTEWNFITGTSFAGSNSLTESISGDYTAADERSVTYKNSFSLTGATGAYLSFWTKYRAENCNDKLQVQVSTNNSTWIPVCGTNTVAEADGTLGAKPALTGIREIWTKELFDLSSYIGNSAMYLRFVFSSNTDATGDDFYKKVDDGFYIDNLKLVKTSAILTTLPVTFLTFTGRLAEGNAVALYWEAYTDSQHDYFEVERSADGSNFISIGRGAIRPPYNLMDKNPAQGVNYYRVKQVDKDGTITYSKIISIVITSALNFVVYPNPVDDVLHINTFATQAQALHIVLSDIQGKEVYRTERSVTATSNRIKLNMKSFKSQLYILKIYDENSSLLSTQKIIKL